jgi:hypothetical protein
MAAAIVMPTDLLILILEAPSQLSRIDAAGQASYTERPV